MADLVCIRTYNNRPEAELAKGLLGASGVKAIVSADDAGGMRPHLTLGMGGVRLLVKKEDVQKVLGILEVTNDKG